MLLLLSSQRQTHQPRAFEQRTPLISKVLHLYHIPHTHTHRERNMPDSYMKTHVVGLAVLQGKHWCYVRTLLTDWRCFVTWAPPWGPTHRKQRIKLLCGPARLREYHPPCQTHAGSQTTSEERCLVKQTATEMDLNNFKTENRKRKEEPTIMRRAFC